MLHYTNNILLQCSKILVLVRSASTRVHLYKNARVSQYYGYSSTTTVLVVQSRNVLYQDTATR